MFTRNTQLCDNFNLMSNEEYNKEKIIFGIQTTTFVMGVGSECVQGVETFEEVFLSVKLALFSDLEASSFRCMYPEDQRKLLTLTT